MIKNYWKKYPSSLPNEKNAVRLNRGNAGAPSVSQKHGQSPLLFFVYLSNGMHFTNRLLVCFLNINSGIYVTLAVFAQNLKRLCVTLRTGKKVKT